MPSRNGMPLQQGFDIWGPLQRRKYLIALFCLVGTALGYLYFAKTSPVYSSSIRLMITTQAPPAIVNGDIKMVDGGSLSKHVNLISSELVLAEAVAQGNLGKLSTFNEISHPVYALKEMIRVVSDGDSDETLSVHCTGPNAEDLPRILNQLTDAYRQNLADDSQNFGKESTDLISQLSSELGDEKLQAEQESFALFTKLGITDLSGDGNIINPHIKKQNELNEQFDGIKLSLKKATDRYELLEPVFTSKDEDEIKVVAIEAKRYLGLSRAQFDESKSGTSMLEGQTLRLPGLMSRNDLEDRIWQYRNRVNELQFDRSEFSTKFGKGYNKIEAIDRRIEVFGEELASMEADLEKYNEHQRKLDEEFRSESDSKGDVPEVDLETFRSREDRQWIKLYRLALERERTLLSRDLQAVGKELQTVSGKATEVAGGVMKLNILQKRIAEKGEAVNVILNQLKEMNILAESFTTTKVKVLDQPLVGEKVAPSLLKSVALGTMLGFLAGFGLAVLVDQSELSFRSPHEIAEKLNIPVVGRIPRINVRKIKPVKGVASLVVAHKPGSTASEAFRDVRTALFFQSNQDDLKTILFTSPSPGDGKSTTTANLAISIAQAGKKVILIDADFRRPRVHNYFDEELSPGLLDVLTGEKGLSDAIQKTPLQENLFLLTAGGRPKNPGELVTSEAFRDLISVLRDKFDYVLIDSPPVLPVSDPASIASFVDGVYMVTRIRKGVKVTSQRAKETLDRVGTRFLGIIINGIDENPHYSEYGYQYGAYSYYGGRYGKYYESNYKEYRDKIAK